MEPEEYVRHDATDRADLVSRGEVTATELASGRHDEVDPTLNAVVADRGDVADKGAANPSLAGPFAGVPFLIKALGQEYAGFPANLTGRLGADSDLLQLAARLEEAQPWAEPHPGPASPGADIEVTCKTSPVTP
jgi:Asp-tRNA(Asn)/Glu-tRNA(Gln) amidotransferase A subunit family amidase